MIGERTLGVLVLLVTAAGCPSSGGGAEPDAAPVLMYQPFTSKTWSLSMIGGAAQLSITDAAGPAACALSEDHRRSLPTGGGKQIILRLPGTVTGTCPAGPYSISTHCAATLGAEAYVPAGCAFYQQWDAQGASLGFATALNGEITIAGTDASCTIRANVGFLGATFSEIFTLTNGAGVQPWCGE